MTVMLPLADQGQDLIGLTHRFETFKDLFFFASFGWTQGHGCHPLPIARRMTDPRPSACPDPLTLLYRQITDSVEGNP
jgi:hypothetical protein